MKNNIDAKMNEGKYEVNLEKLLQDFLTLITGDQNEATIATIFENNLYHFIKTNFDKSIIFNKESGKNFFRHNFKGKIDAISNQVIIEYKSSDKLTTKSDKNKAIRQIKNYMDQLYTNGLKVQGILTNGSKICYLYHVGKKIVSSEFKNIGLRDMKLIVELLVNSDMKSLDPRNIVRDFALESSNGLSLSLSRQLYKNILENPTEKTLMLFQEWEILFRLAETDQGKNQDIIKRRKSLSKIFDTDIHENHHEYLALYVLQTTYALIVKLIASRVLSRFSYKQDIQFFSDLTTLDSEGLQEFMESVEDGYIFTTGGVTNLLEGDFYAWYADKKQWNRDVYKNIYDIISEITYYSTLQEISDSVAVDIFKDLYIKIMPNEVRHSLGEYFTPAWLADNVVNSSIQKLPNDKQNSWSGVDPCCGSGVFLVALINKIYEKYSYDLVNLDQDKKQMILQNILERVSGVDINPLSVLTARVSYFMSIFPLWKNTNSEITIPVYLGDSANIPTIADYDGIKCYKYSILTKKGSIDAVFPVDFVRAKEFYKKMHDLQTGVKAENSHILFENMLDSIENSCKINDTIKCHLKNLCNQLIAMHTNNWDGIWIRILSNFMMVAKFYNIDIIVGNPPWVKWEFLPTNYANKIKGICIDHKLFSGQRYMGAISLNICALIANVTAGSWLSKDGVLAFLMPKTIMTQDSYSGFRNFYIKNDKRMYLVEADDWSRGGNPFEVTTEKFMAYYYTRHYVDYTVGIPVNFYTKNSNISIFDINKYSHWHEIEKSFLCEKGLACQLDSARTGFTFIPPSEAKNVNGTLLKDLRSISGKPEYKARSGVEFTPAEVYFITPYESKSSSNNREPKLKHWFIKSDFRNTVHKNLINGPFELGTKYILPVIKGPMIKSFDIQKSNNYCIYPYEYGSRDSVSLKDMNVENKLLANYLLINKKLIGKQSQRSKDIAQGSEFYSLSKVGSYTYSPYKVVFRDNTIMHAAVVEPVETPWGTTVLPIPAKHAPYISVDNTGTDISEDEAHYISGIMNSTIVKEYFRLTYSGRSYSIRFNIKLPKYNPDNEMHVYISNLAKKARYSNNKNKYSDEISNIYI